MPEMDGITALGEIRAVDPEAVCIMCSAMGQQAMVIDAIQKGAKDFIVKPFQADRVLESLHKMDALVQIDGKIGENCGRDVRPARLDHENFLPSPLSLSL